MAAPKGLNKTQIAREYKDAHPEIKHDRTLAKLMQKELPDIFKSVEKARNAVRNAVGAMGDEKRNGIRDKKHFKVLTHDTTPPKKVDDLREAKILVLDIETAPMTAFAWRAWKQNLLPQQIITDWFMLTWAAKWLFENKYLSERLTPAEARKQDDKRIVKSLWKALDEADIIIAHNGDKFDIPSINTRFLTFRLNPPSPYQTVDTLKTLQKQFNFTHNKLDYVSRLLLERKKIDTDFGLWRDCYSGKEDALKKMERYNINDVKLLEEMYLLLRPWIKPHPNVNLFLLDGKEGCPTCGSKDLKEGGVYRTFANNFQALQCKNCGAQGRRRLSAVNIEQKRSLIYSTAK